MNTRANESLAFHQGLSAVLASLPPVRRYWVAYSGGMDSHALLHAVHQVLGPSGPELAAVHVNHGLSPDAGRWERHCQQVCDQLAVPLTRLRVDAAATRGESPEAAARRARYGALEGLVADGDCLLTAHHQDDQAETLLLQLLRGAGPRGMAAMPICAPFAAGIHARPLLGFSRAQLRRLAKASGRPWVEDRSNFDTGLARNFLRHEVLPKLRLRWPAASATIARAATHAAETSHLLDGLAETDLRRVLLSPERGGVLSVREILGLDAARQANLLRYWIRRQGLPLPATRHIEQLQRDVLAAAGDARPLLRWPGAEVRRYRDRLYAMPPLPAHAAGEVVAWDLRAPLRLPANSGCLVAEETIGTGLARAACAGAEISVRYRQGGERCRPAGSTHSSSLKKLLQAAGVPPWERARIPLVYHGETLAAVSDMWVCAPFQCRPGEPGWVIRWRPNPG